jgi:alpha-L-fucosidase
VRENGNVPLNIGPRADGSIPGIHPARLQGLGNGLAVNAEAIYGRRPWRMPGALSSLKIGAGASPEKR